MHDDWYMVCRSDWVERVSNPMVSVRVLVMCGAVLFDTCKDSDVFAVLHDILRQAMFWFVLVGS
jgi:hypothetical protein